MVYLRGSTDTTPSTPYSNLVAPPDITDTTKPSLASRRLVGPLPTAVGTWLGGRPALGSHTLLGRDDSGTTNTIEANTHSRTRWDLCN